MAKKILGTLVLIAFLVISIHGVYAGCTNGVLPPSGPGNWQINNTTTCSNMTISVNGNLIINNSGSLTLSNVTLQLNHTISPNAIVVNSSGTLNAYLTNFTTNNTTAGYTFNFLSGSAGTINNSRILYLNNTTVGKGFYVASNIKLINTTIIANNGYGLYIINSTPTLNNIAINTSTIGVLVNNSNIKLYNSTINASGNDTFLANNGNLTLFGCTFNETNVSSHIGPDSLLNVSWYIQAFVKANGTTSVPVSGATVKFYSNNTTLRAASTTNASGITPRIVLTEYIRNSSTNKTFNVYNISTNKSSGSYDFVNFTYFNISSNKILGNNITAQMFYPVHRVSFIANSTWPNMSVGGFSIINLILNNTGNTWDTIKISDNASGWTFSYLSNNTNYNGNDKSINLSVSNTADLGLRIEPPSTALPGKTYKFKITANSTASNSRGTWNASYIYLNVTINGAALNWANITQNATDFLENSQASRGSWNDSNYTTAWALWALNYTYGSNFTRINNTLHLFSNTTDANGIWTDANFGNYVATSLVLIAHSELGYTNSTAPADLHKAANYLVAHVNESKSMPKTAIMLTAIYKTGVNTSNANVTWALDWMMRNQTNSTSGKGSWGNNTEWTAWGLMALTAASNTSQNRTNARIWLRNNQRIKGNFGSISSLNDTFISIIALSEDNAGTTWTVDADDGNFSTTYDQYPGSIQRALNWVMLKRDTTKGGWGNSPANNLTTAMAVAAISGAANYGTVFGNVTGTGNATGYNISNAIVSFNSSSANYTVATNGTGFYSINLPAGTYTVLVKHNAFETNSSVNNLTIYNGEEVNQNFGVRPKINVTGLFAGNLLNATGLNGGTDFRIRGKAVYAYNNAPLKGTVYFTSDHGNPIHGSAIWSNSTDGIFTKDKTAPSPNSTTTYTITLWINDSYGSNGTKTATLTVAGSGGGSSSSSGGSGGAAAGDYGLIITAYDQKVTVAQGETKTTQLVAKNSGAAALEDVGLTLVGINSSWYSVNVSGTGAKTEDLDPNEAVTYNIKFTIPDTASAKMYAGTWKVTDKNGLAIAEKNMNLTITQVWTNKSVSELSENVSTLKKNLTALSTELEKLKRHGKNVTALLDKLNTLNKTISDAEAKLAVGDYSSAKDLIANANSLISEVNAGILDLTTTGGFTGLSLGKLGAIILIVGISIAGGLLVWFKFLRVIPIQEIKQYPDRFFEGARIEGVVKSITDTKKGKVFLIQDDTGKLHVRYPYYSTLEVGDLIRARGAIKTYQGTPYMDASDLQKIIIKNI